MGCGKAGKCMFAEQTDEYHGGVKKSCMRLNICHNKRAQPGQKTPARGCNSKSCAGFTPEIGTSVIVTGCNESDMVATCKSLSEDPTVKQIIALDDFSDIPVTPEDRHEDYVLGDDKKVTIVRSPEPLGVGGSRNYGEEFALESVYTFVDAHMRFPDEVVGKTSRVAMEKMGIACPSCHSMSNKSTGCGANIFWHRKKGVVIKWHYSKGQGLERLSSFLGACYTIPKIVWDKLGGAWLDTFGRWGYSEQALSIMAKFAGIDVWGMSTCHANHLFRNSASQPYQVPGGDPGRNQIGCLFLLFGDSLWNSHWKPMLRNKRTEDWIDALEKNPEVLKKREQISQLKERSDAEVFQWLLELALEHNREPDSKGEALKLLGRSANSTIKKPEVVAKPKVESLRPGSEVTFLLLNYKRPGNIPKVIESIRMQDVPTKIFLWNNGDPLDPVPKVDKLIQAADNEGCWARWPMASLADTPYICTLDDDISFSRPDVLRKALMVLQGKPASTIVGPFGVILDPSKSYKTSKQIQLPPEDTPVDLVKGRLMLMNRLALSKVSMMRKSAYSREDDIAVSGLIAEGKPGKHLVLGCFRGGLKNLPTMNTGNDTRPNHYRDRDAATKVFFPWVYAAAQRQERQGSESLKIPKTKKSIPDTPKDHNGRGTMDARTNMANMFRRRFMAPGKLGDKILFKGDGVDTAKAVHYPEVTCLCPTYGRISLLQRALQSFLYQDWPNRKLIICNDHPDIELSFDHPQVEVINTRRRFANLGQKRQYLLLQCKSRFAAHWDDDDIYLPNHLSQGMIALMSSDDKGCVKQPAAWMVMGQAGSLSLKDPKRNTFEGMMMFQKGMALQLGGYSMKDSGQALDLLNAFKQADSYEEYEVDASPTYVYSWSNGSTHVSVARSKERYDSGNTDLGDGTGVLVPGGLAEVLDLLAEEKGILYDLKEIEDARPVGA